MTDRRTKQPDRLLTLREIRDLTGVTDRTVDTWRKRFGLPIVKLGAGIIRVQLCDWLAFIEKSRGIGLKSPAGGTRCRTKPRRVAARIRP